MSTQELDRELVADLLAWYLPRSDVRGNKQRLARRSGYGPRSIYRILEADPSVSAAVLMAVAHKGLGIPHETLVFAGMYDIEGMEQIGVPADIVRWADAEVKKRSSGYRVAEG